MNNFNNNNQPPLDGNLKFNPCPGIDLNANVNKLPPKLMIAIGLSLAALGLYLHLNQEKDLNKTN